MLRYVCVVALLVAAVASVPVEQERKSPCPGRFEYDVVDKEAAKGQWAGVLTLDSEYRLYGVWIRVFFDRPVEDVTSPDGLVEIRKNDDNKGFLLHNREFILKKNDPTKVRFVVHYKGDEVPSLVHYRLNAREVCVAED